MKIFKRVLISELAIAIGLIVIMFCTLPRIVYVSGRSAATSESMDMNEQLITRLDTYFKDLEKFGSSVEYDYELNNLLYRDLQRHSIRTEARIKNYLSNLGRYNKMDPYEVFGIVFEMDNGREYTTIGLNESLWHDIHSEVLPEYYRNGCIPLYSKPLVFKNVEVQPNVFTDTPTRVYCYVYPYANGTVKGNMVIISRYDSISSIFANYVKAKKTFLLLDRNNEPLFPGNDTLSVNYQSILSELELQHTYMESSLEKGNSLFTIRYSRYGDWKLIVEETRNAIMKRNQGILVMYFSFLLVYLVSFFGILIPFLNKVLTPLYHLAQQMKKVSEGNLDVKIEVKTHDEIGELGSIFNYMLAELKMYIDTLVEKNKKENELRYSFMLSRIDPHFIYNTMNTITYLARKGQSGDVVQVNEAMIEILKDRLRIDVYDSFDTIAHEIEITKRYLVIQEYRYRDIFKVKWEVLPELLQDQIPKSMIQPLVENALYHGILGNKDEEGEVLGGLITISVLRTKRKICIEVKDNGRGMSEAEYQDAFDPETAGRGERIGLKNIRERLFYIYGNAYDFAVITKEGFGTRVFLTVPFVDSPPIQ